ncbi:unnamed protein product [Rotaria socialis]|uniref:BTB domain-containing protein n=1 Tax=Rotaria socialis TaxID=392032 RepID=A0A817Y3Z5_9BILA|nr:unnamed protein product [Rotaria socialis]CAF3374355.1 unnamed protein product [Rotaria socialis]CAF4111038.1 unnamed protein product [Rotaria socialis]CAF4244505.1 unnamed protein product [Rotaria socialis]
MSRKNLRRSGGAQIEETAGPQGMETADSLCSQRQISDVCEAAGLSDQGVGKGSVNDIGSVQQQGGEGIAEEATGAGDEQNEGQLSSSSSNPSVASVAKAIPTNEADMLCTTIENVSHVRFEWTVEDFYPQMYECGDMIQSEEFPPYDLQKEFWTLRLYPKGHQRLSKEQQNQPSTGGASTTDDDSTTQFYLSLCPSHVASQHPSNASTGTANGQGSNNPNHIASSLMNTSSRQLQVYFRALINFSNPQGRIFHTETVHDCGGNITDELVIMKMSRALCEQLYKDSKDHLIISIELMSIDDIAKRSMKTSTSKMVEGSSRVVSKVMKMKLRWKIEKFSTLVNESPNNSFIESCEFTFNKQRPGNVTNIQTAAPEQTGDDDEQMTNGANTNENKAAATTTTTTTTPQNDIPPHQWSLILYPSGKTERFKESLSVFLEHTFGPSVRVVIRFSLIDARGRRVNTKQLPSHVLAPGERWGVGDFIKHSTLLQAQQQLFPGNELRLYCQIKILERQSIDERKYISRPLVALPRTSLNKPSATASISEDPATYWPTLFYTAYLEKRMCDMYLRCGNELYSVHKLILGLRSNVLARMIKEKETATVHPTAVSPPAKPTRHGKRATASTANTTSESMETETQGATGAEDSSLLTIDINDIDRKTILFFLEYVYTGGIKKLGVPGAGISHTLVIDLLTIAANYEMPDLKTYAEYYLKDIIRVDNACELLMLSDNMKSEMLKQTTCDYIANNLGNVMETTGWTELKAKQPDLIDTILKSCLLLRK